MSMARLSLGLFTVVGLAATAQAGDIWIGNASGQIDRNAPLGTQTVFPTLCTQVNAMVAVGPKLYLADSFGSIWKLDTSTLSFDFMPQSFTTTSLAVHNGDLLAGSSDGKLRRIRVSDGVVLSTVTIGATVDALAVEGDTVFIGGHDTLIRKGAAASGSYTVIGACGGQVHSLAVNGGELLAAALDGKVYRINKATGQYLGTYLLPAGLGAPQVAMDGAFLVTGGVDGLLRWLNPITGAVQFSTATCSDIRALAVAPRCKVDTDRDGQLTANDFSTFINVYAAASPHADINSDGRFNVNDFISFINAYAVGCP